MKAHWEVSNCPLITPEEFHGHLVTWNAWKWICGPDFKQKCNLERARGVWNLRESSRADVLAQLSGAQPSQQQPSALWSCQPQGLISHWIQAFSLLSSAQLTQGPSQVKPSHPPPPILCSSLGLGSDPAGMDTPSLITLHSSTACNCVLNS